MPSEMDLKSFDLTRNLTSSLSELVRQSILRVKRGKRSLPERFLREYLVKILLLSQVHRIERIGNSMNVIFSLVETDVDSKILENDLSSLDLNYLSRFLAFPVLSAVARANTDNNLNFIVLGILSSLLSIVFLCILFRSILKDFAKTYAVSVTATLTAAMTVAVTEWRYQRTTSTALATAMVKTLTDGHFCD
uniref:Transmembrane protein n=1 Tax=Angiostrongylus cantonensis TaxID=6313 RepID=A0A0K0DQ01_ANGCA